jgi:hypothetical protein
VPFFIDHPVLPDYSREDNLPQLQLHLSHVHSQHDTTEANQDHQALVQLIQLHRSWVHRNSPNVWHFQAALDPSQAEAAHALGVQGWSSYVSINSKPLCSMPETTLSPKTSTSHPSDSSGRSIQSGQVPSSGNQAAGMPIEPYSLLQSLHQLPWQSQGGVWAVVGTAQGVPLDQHAFLLQQHLQYHALLGLSGMIHILSNAAQAGQLLMESRELVTAVTQGRLVLWVWVSPAPLTYICILLSDVGHRHPSLLK